ncbi:MAG: ATPase, T2SS/T4P/T4SS family, partial [Pirellulales bacterium]
MKKILFPTDYSPASNAALRYAVSLAKPSAAKLLIVYVEPPSLPPVGGGPPESPTREEEAFLAKLLQSLDDDGHFPAHEIRKLRGDPATEIVRLARDEDVDLIVMATEGRSGLRRVLMGSVAESIVRTASCPVLTLKEPQANKPAIGPLPSSPKAGEAESAIEFHDPGSAIAEAEGSRALVLLRQAIEARATDVHLQPVDGHLEVRLRVDGRLEHHCRLSEDVGHHVVTQLKVLAELDISDPFHPQEGRVHTEEGLDGYEVRITTVPAVGGQSVALRLLNRDRLLRPLASLGLTEVSRKRIEEMLRESGGEGVVLVTGPANSGKTTTAYSMIHALDDGHRNIVTIEDPPEYHIPSFRQLAADRKHDVTMTSGLRTLLRMDPDIVLVGEIRDVEAAEIAMRAASSGKFVFTTMHTRDVAATVTALRDLHIDNRSLAGNLTGI